MFKKIISGMAVAVVVFLSVSCPSSLSKEMVLEVQDSVVPVLTITSPENEDAYGAYTLVSGTVKDLADNGEEGKVVSLYVEILGVTGDVNIPLKEDGSFSTVLETNGAGYSSDIVMKLTATDWNGNMTEETLALKKADGEITGFTVTAGNRSAEITWDPLPEASSYTIQEFRSGTSVTGITKTSYMWENLVNGNKCSFRVSAEVNGGTYYSSIEEAIPLAESTLTPDVESVYRGINLRWKDIPAASEYVVERSKNEDGPYSIRTITSDSFFSDTKLKRGEVFYYRVYPVERLTDPDIMISASRYGCAGYFHGRNDYSVFSSVDTPNSSFETVIRDDYAYVADGTDGLWIADISDIYNPVLVGNCDTPGEAPDYIGNAQGLAISGDYAYIANRETGMQIIDISNPYAPFLLDVSYDSDGGAVDSINKSYGVALSDNSSYAYLADSASGLRVLNISGASQPTSEGVDEDLVHARKVVVDDTYAYVADGSDGLQIINISNPSEPSTVASCSATDARGITLASIGDSDYAFIADRGNPDPDKYKPPYLRIIDVTDPSSVVDSSEVASYGTPGEALGVTIAGSRAYVACSISGLTVLDVSTLDAATPGDPTLIGSCYTPGDTQSVTVKGDYAFVSSYNSGLQIIDISEPSASLIAGILGSIDEIREAAVSGDYAYVTMDAEGIKVIDISDPADPQVVGNWSVTDTNTKGIAISGNYAYVADYDLGLQILDISDPSNPVLVATCDIKAETPGHSEGIAVSGSYAYIAEKRNGLQIVDISDPAHPVIAGLCDTDGESKKVAVSGDYAYVGDNEGGLKVINISDPYLPYQVGSIATTIAYGVAVEGNYLYLADDTSGLRIIDISDPANPSLTTTFDTSGEARGVTISGSYAFVTNINDGDTSHFCGLKIIDISDPENPVDVTSIPTTDAEGVAVAGHYAFVSDRIGGFRIVNLGE